MAFETLDMFRYGILSAFVPFCEEGKVFCYDIWQLLSFSVTAMM